jgi:tape measure domain-containing protein
MADEISVWLRVRDAARFQAEMARSSAAVSRLGSAANTAGGLASSGLMAIGRASASAAAALGAAGGAAAVLGVKYNATMEQNEVAFANFLGSQKRARQELEWLRDFAAKSPFELPDVIAGSRKLLAFGMSAKESREALGSIGEAAAGLGLAGPDINRMVMAIGQIQAKGKVSTEELLQMAELGVPAFDILKKSMNLTGAELEKKLRDGAISADKGIGVLLTGMDKRFDGSMKGQAKTFSGQMSTLKDNAMQMLGEVSKPLFNWLKDSLLPGINDALPTVKRLIMGIGPAVKAGFGAAKPVIEDVVNAFKPMAPFLSNVLLPILKGVAIGVIGSIVMAFKLAVPIIKILATALGWIGTKLAPLKGAFQTFGTIIGFLFSGAILKAIGLLTKFGGIFKVVGVAARLFAVPIRFVIGIFRLWFSAIRLLVGTYFKILGAGLRALGGPFRAIGSTASRVWGVIRSGLSAIIKGIASAPGRIATAAAGMFNGIRNAFKSAINWIIGKWNSLEFKIPGFDPPGPGPKFGGITIGVPDIPLLAAGGVVRPGVGSWITGDAGPELNTWLPGGGVRVDPLTGPRSGDPLPAFPTDAAPQPTLHSPNTPSLVHATFRVGQRVLVDAVAEGVSDELAGR